MDDWPVTMPWSLIAKPWLFGPQRAEVGKAVFVVNASMRDEGRNLCAAGHLPVVVESIRSRWHR
jgi:hypothetical protein